MHGETCEVSSAISGIHSVSHIVSPSGHQRTIPQLFTMTDNQLLSNNMNHPVDCLCVKHTAFKPVGRGNLAASLVEGERKKLDSYLNMARIHKFEDSTVQLLRSTCDQKGTEGISGLIYGVFQAWKDEKAVAIAPQHIWFTITCQVATVCQRSSRQLSQHL